MTDTLKRIALAAGLAALAGCAMAQPAPQGGRPLTAAMTGAAEVPPGDPDGKGTASFRVNLGQGQVCYDISVSGITLPAGAAHIHKGAPGAAGGPVVMLKAPDATGKVSDCATADAAVLKDILQNPQDYYVNVHTSDFRAGALRGQLSK